MPVHGYGMVMEYSSLWYVMPVNLAEVRLPMVKTPHHSKSFSDSPRVEHNLPLRMSFKAGHNLAAGCDGKA